MKIKGNPVTECILEEKVGGRMEASGEGISKLIVRFKDGMEITATGIIEIKNGNPLKRSEAKEAHFTDTVGMICGALSILKLVRRNELSPRNR